MNRIILSFLLLLFTLSSFAQTRIDSSFAFSTNPAKKYSIYVPTAYNAASPNKLMIGFHPLNLARWDAESWCDTLINFAETNNLLLVCPDGGANGNITDMIDYDFTEALMDSVKLWYNIDTNNVYAMGFSMGGVATYEYGLNHASDFGGFIPIGAAVSGSSAFSAIISNAECKPYYLVHGNNDSPAVRFTPMLNDLNSNCAIVNSLLMSGVGHTIDFPNRNQILSDAFFWIDSVNNAPTNITTTFGPLSPVTGSSFVIQGFQDQSISYVWESSSFAPKSCTSYELLVDALTGDFSNPLFTFNAGQDTSITFTYHQIDSMLQDGSIAIGGNLSLKWAVAVKHFNKYMDTTKATNIAFTRQRVGFQLVTPSNNSNRTLANGQNSFFNWDDLLGMSIKYNLLFDTIGGDFSNPLHVYESANGSATSLRTVNHIDLYYNVIVGNLNLTTGDTAKLLWTAEAYDSTYSELATAPRRINFVLDDIGFRLIAPDSNLLVLGKSGVVINFLWDSIPSNGVTYEWIMDTIGGDFSNPLTSFSSNSNGTANSLSADISIIDSVMNVFNISYGDTLDGKWTVKATTSQGEFFAFRSHNIQVYRDFPEGVEETNGAENIVVFPVPTQDILTVNTGLKQGSQFNMMVYDNQGRIVKNLGTHTSTGRSFEIDLSELNTGTYFLSIISNRESAVVQVVVQN